MRLLSAFVLVIVLIICTSACMAQPPVDELDCTNIAISPQLDDCVKKQMTKSNAQLADVMLDFDKRATQMYTADPALGKELIDRVHKTQDAWISFRDLNCAVEAFEIEPGTPAYITTVNNCIIRMNGERIEVLKKLL